MQRKTSKGAAPARVAGAPTLDIPPDTTAENLIGTINDRLRRTYKAAVDVRQQGSSSAAAAGILVNGTPKGTGDINLKAGSNVTITGSQNGGAVDVSIAAATALKVDKGGTLVGTRPEVNLIAGSNVTLTVADNSGSNRVDVTIASSGGGGGGSGPPYPTLTAPPTSGSFTNVQGTATAATDTLSQLVITCPGSSVTWYPFTVAAPAAPWSFIAGFRMTGDFAGGFLGGLCISDGTKYVYFFTGQDVGIQYNSAVQTFGSTLLGGRSNDGQRGGVFFMKIRDDGTTNRTYSISTDGQNWIQVYSEGRTTNFTATKLGYVVLGSSSAFSGQEMVFHHSVA